MECSRCKHERWVRIEGFESYQISDHGRVRSKTGRLMRPGKLRRGHLRVTLCQGGERTSFQVHHLVLRHFVGARPEGSEGLHNNDIPADNCFKNLRWGTRSDNMRDAVANGRMPHVHAPLLREQIVTAVATGARVQAEARRHGIPRRTIYDWLKEEGVTPPKLAKCKPEILDEVFNGASVKAAAKKHGVSERALYTWLAKSRAQDD